MLRGGFDVTLAPRLSGLGFFGFKAASAAFMQWQAAWSLGDK